MQIYDIYTTSKYMIYAISRYYQFYHMKMVKHK